MKEMCRRSLQKPLKALESRGNPYGKMEKKRADWAGGKEFQQICDGQDPRWEQSRGNSVFCR